MFDVLVYLYENYWRPDACPEHEQLTRKLSSVGFESDRAELSRQLLVLGARIGAPVVLIEIYEHVEHESHYTR
ncbi:MAG TPA: DUF494 family protein, partial [Caldimonas sp.]